MLRYPATQIRLDPSDIKLSIRRLDKRHRSGKQPVRMASDIQQLTLRSRTVAIPLVRHPQPTQTSGISQPGESGSQSSTHPAGPSHHAQYSPVNHQDTQPKSSQDEDLIISVEARQGHSYTVRLFSSISDIDNHSFRTIIRVNMLLP
jgi:hypothetical protein